MENNSSLPLFTSKIEEEVKIRLTNEGSSSWEPVTVLDIFHQTVHKCPNKEALLVKRNNEWKKWTYQEYYDECIMFAKSLIFLNVKPRTCIAIIGFNSPEWFIANIGSICAACVATGIYTTNNPEACEYIANHCEAEIIVVENEIQLNKFLKVKHNLLKLKALVIWDGKVPENEKNIYHWNDFIKLGEKIDDSEIKQRMEMQKPGNCCTLIYTSGTTGMPKAVMISHDNITWTTRNLVQLYEVTNNEKLVSFLPLSHIAAQIIDIHGAMCVGGTVYFAQPDALKGSLLQTIKEVKPTIFFGVPRVWEKFQEKMLEIGKQISGLKKIFADWAKSIGLEGGYNEQKGYEKPWGWWIADNFVFKKIKQSLGMDQVRYYLTGAAPISKDTLEYFLSLNIPIFEIYGMSECSGPHSINYPGNYKTCSAGKTLPGCQTKILEPDKDGNGEICMFGRHIFMGYFKNESATKETIDNDGFLHSGDIGKIENEFLYITGRIKEILITSGGENIAPILIEDEIKKEIGDIISQVMVIGDKKKFLSAIITLKAEPKTNIKPGEYPFTDNLASNCNVTLLKIGSSSRTIEDAIHDEKIYKYIQSGIERANKRAISNAQKIQKFMIAPKDFTIEENELTPTMKLKRRIVIEKYNGEIEKMYQNTENN